MWIQTANVRVRERNFSSTFLNFFKVAFNYCHLDAAFIFYDNSSPSHLSSLLSSSLDDEASNEKKYKRLIFWALFYY
jgi:hypothetical protein